MRETRNLLIRLSPPTYEKLRKLAFDKRKPMSAIIRELLEQKLK